MHNLDTPSLAAICIALQAISRRGLPVALVGAGPPDLHVRLLSAKPYADRLFQYPELAAQGTALVFGPVADPVGVLGLAVVSGESMENARALTTEDPTVTSGVSRCEVYPMPRAIVAPAVAAAV